MIIPLCHCLLLLTLGTGAVAAENDMPGPGPGQQNDQGQRPPRPEDGQGIDRPRRDQADRPGRNDRPAGGGGGQQYNLEQAMSDKAQLHTIAFSGLAFLTGDFGASTFIPPGKVCDYFGFQYMRDIDAAHKGHNPMFLNRVVGNVLSILDEGQQKQFSDLAQEQGPQLEELARMRLPVIAAFHRQADQQLPAGSQGLNRAAVTAAIGALFRRDMELSLRRAEVMAAVARSLSDDQKARFAQMTFGDFNSWQDIDERDALKKRPKGQSQMVNVAFMTYASEFFSWTAGSVDADVYFCPERHGTYFGGFYMKDMPAMGKKNFDISTSVTGESGRTLVEEVLTPTQSKLITDVVALQRDDLKDMAVVRRQIATELRKLLTGAKPDRAALMDMGQRYGERDGDASWLMATAFAQVKATLTDEQKATMKKLRNLDGYTSAPYYIYSRAAKDAIDVKAASDALFFAPKKQ